VSTSASQKKSKKKQHAVVSEIADQGDATATKPRIKIRLKLEEVNAEKSKKAKAPKRKRDDSLDDGLEADVETTPIPRKKKTKVVDDKASKKVSSKKVRSEAPEAARVSDSHVDDVTKVDEPASESNSKFVDLDFWKNGREGLDGSFGAARIHFMQMGPWRIPGQVSPERFADVAKLTLAKMDK
jgi:hypothetical protein